MKTTLAILAALATVSLCCQDEAGSHLCQVTLANGFCNKPCTTFWAHLHCEKTCGFCGEEAVLSASLGEEAVLSASLGKEPPCSGDTCPCVDYEEAATCAFALTQHWCQSSCTKWWAYQWCKKSCKMCSGINGDTDTDC